MFNIVLVHPEIPPNTGNVIRLAANTGCRLHLIEPLGFSLDEKSLRRAGLDYHEYAAVKKHESWSAFLASESPAPERLFALTTKASQTISAIAWQLHDWLVFGSETAGLPLNIRENWPDQQQVRLPMRPEQRSLNLSNAVAITVYEAWRQQNYAGGV
jgi:tRNA (cytidine/uridine-2'-O-)-methyltransferase